MKNVIKHAMIIVLFFFGSMSVLQAQINSAPQMNTTEEVEIPKIFKTYDWLNKLVDYKECKEGKIIVYSHGEIRFIYVDKDNKKVLYTDEGLVYCSSSVEINCMEFYKFTTTIYTWDCE